VVAEVGLSSDELTAEFKKLACRDLSPWEIPRRWVCIHH